MSRSELGLGFAVSMVTSRAPLTSLSSSSTWYLGWELGCWRAFGHISAPLSAFRFPVCLYLTEVLSHVLPLLQQ